MEAEAVVNDVAVTNVIRTSVRCKLPDTRRSITHKFSVAGQKGYITVGLYDDGRPGEIFIRIAKEGSTLSGFMDSFATMTSIALQYGVPLEIICSKFSHVRFEPQGWSEHEDIGYASSLVDYLFRWLELKFIGKKIETISSKISKPLELTSVNYSEDAPGCPQCGSIMQRNGTCYGCSNCGITSGCS